MKALAQHSAGTREVLRLMAELCRRRKREETPYRLAGAGRGLPMVCLISPEEGPNGREDGRHPLVLLDRFLAGAGQGRVPHLRIPLEIGPGPDGEPGRLRAATSADVEQIRHILRQCATSLTGGRRTQGRLRYPLFQLTDWLMEVSFSGDQDRDRQLRAKLRGRWWKRHPLLKDTLTAAGDHPDEAQGGESRAAGGAVSATLAAGSPSWAASVLNWLRVGVNWLMPVRALPSWFMKQYHLTPQDPGDPIGFAVRLTKDEWPHQDLDQVCLLLVNAFLEDLRRAYRCQPGLNRPLWRGRRMTYPVLLLDGITRSNGGYRLLALINDVRNETGYFDPLLVVSASRRVPPDAQPETVPRDGSSGQLRVWPCEEAADAYQAWCSALVRSSRARKPTAWYLPISAPSSAALRDQTAIDAAGPISVDCPTRRSAARNQLAAAVAVAAALIVSAFFWSGHLSAEHCGVGWWNSGATTLQETGGECVGVTDGTYPFQPAQTLHLADVEEEIGQLNQQAAARHDQYPGRPYITLVYLAVLTTTSPGADLTAEREELEGVADAQDLQLNVNTGPIVRVLLANAGTSMLHGPEVAAILQQMTAADPRIAAVVGLDQSRLPTINTIRALEATGLPVIAATPSADELAGKGGSDPISPFYFQIAPQNQREAQFTAAFAAQLAAPGTARITRTVRIVYSADKSDTYSNNLEQDAATAFQSAKFEVQADTFTPSSGTVSGNAMSEGQDACKFSGIVLFAGRTEDFENFLNGVNSSCPGNPPLIVGDDDVARFVADPAKLGLYSVPFYYVSFATGQDSCANQTGNGFYGTMDQLFPFECRPQRYATLDGHAALNYDAAETVIHAVDYLQDSATGGQNLPITPGTIWDAISSLDGNQAYAGQSGEVDFGGAVNQHVPLDKAIAIMHAQGGQQPAMTGFCGKPDRPGVKDNTWCPAMQP